jgi:phage-related protein (TIGR01555 family)
MGRRKKRGKQITIPVRNSLAGGVNNAIDSEANYGGYSSNVANLALNWPGFQIPLGNNVQQPGSIFENLRYTLVSNLRQILSQAYAELGLIQTICKVPVEDALRGGITIHTAQLSEEEISELVSFREEQGDDETTGEAAEWNRLYGGAGIIIFTDQDPETPLDIENIQPDENVEFRAVDLWELFHNAIEDSAQHIDPILDPNLQYYDYYGERIHRSRIIILKGIKAPSFIRPRLRGWGISVIETLVSGVNQYLKAASLTYEVLDEFKLDIYRISNFATAALGPNGGTERSIRDQVEIVNFMKNFQNAIVLDKDDEYESKQLSFAGLAEAQAGVRMQIASDMRMPLTKLFGMSAAGFNSGEDDIEVYNGMIESSIRAKLKRPIMTMVKIRCQQLFGFIPDDLKIEFKPLRVLSSTDEETVKTSLFNRALSARQAGEISAEAFSDICNRGNLFPIKIESAPEPFDVDDEFESAEDDRESLGDTNPEDGEDENADDSEGIMFIKRPKLRVANAEDEDTAPPILVSPKSKKTPRVKKPISAEEKMRRRLRKKNKSGIVTLPKPYTAAEKIRRAINSRAFDLKSYEADGGDDWIDPRRREFFDEPVGIDQTLWGKARVASREVFGEIRWQFVAWMYKKLGGRYTA